MAVFVNQVAVADGLKVQSASFSLFPAGENTS